MTKLYARTYVSIGKTLFKPGEKLPELDDATWARLTKMKAIDTEADPVEIVTGDAGEDEVLPPRNASPAKAEPEEPEEADEAEEGDEPEDDGVAEEADEPEEGEDGEEPPALPLIDGADAIVATPKATEKKPEAAKTTRKAKK